MFHPVFNAIVRANVRIGLRENGVGLIKALSAAWSLGDDDIMTYSMAVPTPASMPAGLLAPENGVPGAIFDGSIVQAIMDWLKSDEGRAFLAQLAKIIIAALMAALGL